MLEFVLRRHKMTVYGRLQENKENQEQPKHLLTEPRRGSMKPDVGGV